MKIDKWIKWWTGEYDEETHISHAGNFYIILPVSKGEDGFLRALVGLAVDATKFQGDVQQFLIAKREQYIASQSYGALPEGAQLLDGSAAKGANSL